MRVTARVPWRDTADPAMRRAMPAVAGLALLAALGAALARVLAAHPPPPAPVVAGGCALLGMIALALWRLDAAVTLAVLLSAVVLVEPAPVDATFAVIIAVAVATGRFGWRRVPVVMTGLCGLFFALNLLSAVDAVDPRRAVAYLSITLYLLLFSLWACGYVDRRSRARLVVRAYVAVAVASAVAGTLAVLVTFPGSVDLATGHGERAKALFKDPNVYGPFLIPAALILLEEALTPRLLRLSRPVKLLCFAVLSVGVVFSYSRAAWLNLTVATLVMLVTLALRRGGSRRAVALLVVAGVVLASAYATVVLTGSTGFLEERARLQTYDTQRFGAQRTGVELAQSHPLGIGPGQFEVLSPVSAHSTYVRALAEEGVLGAGVIIAIILGTLVMAVANAVAGRSTYGIGSATLLAAWCGVMANSAFIDTLHWRHVWLLAALVWAGTATAVRRPQVFSSTRPLPRRA